MDITFDLRPAARRRSSVAPAPALRLERNTATTLRLARGTCIAVSAGRLWLTESGDLGDHFIAAGRHHMVRRAGQVVIEGDSLQPAEYRLMTVRHLRASRTNG